MNIDFRFRTAAAYSKAVPHLLALAEIEEEEDKAQWTALEPVTEVHAAADAVVQEQVVDAATRELLTQTTAPLELLGITNTAEETPALPLSLPGLAPTAAESPSAQPSLSSIAGSANPLASLMGGAPAPTTQPASGVAAQPAPAPTPEPSEASADPLASLLPTAVPIATEFVVFAADGSKLGGYVSQADALKVYVYAIEQTTSSEALEAVIKANTALRDQLDRGGKTAATKAYNNRKEHLAAIMAALAGEQSPGLAADSPAMAYSEFLDKFSALASKAGPQAVTEVYATVGCKSHKDMAAESYGRALELMQQVIDNKGK